MASTLYVLLLITVRKRTYEERTRPTDGVTRVRSFGVRGESTMSSNSTNQDQYRLEQIIELKQGTFCYQPLREAIAEELKSDEQFRLLLELSEQSRQFVTVRDSQVGCDSRMRNSIAGYGEALDEALHYRSVEIITKLCASYVRRDDRWSLSDPDSVDMTGIQAYFDAREMAFRWLRDHQRIVAQLDLTVPEEW